MEQCCPPLFQPGLGSDDAERLARVFKALSDPARVRLLSLMAEQGEVCVCNLPGPLGLSQPTVSHHLKVLLDAGIVQRESRGTWAYYKLVPDAMRSLSDALQPA